MRFMEIMSENLSQDYITALFDARGYFHHSILTIKGRQQPRFKTVLSLNNRPDLLQRIQAQLGGRIYKRAKNGNLTLEWHNRTKILALLRYLQPAAQSSALSGKIAEMLEKLEEL